MPRVSIHCAHGNPNSAYYFGSAPLSFYLSLQIILPLDKSYGDSSIGNFIARQDADIVHTKLSADVCQYLMAVLQFNLEHGVG